MSTPSSPTTLLRVLLVEDSEPDAELLTHHLQQAGFTVAVKRVDTPSVFQTTLHRQPWDVIISDYSMPRFSGLKALELAKASGLDIPFSLVSGSVGEDVAVNAMRAGASDYLIKDRLTRLGPVVTRELAEAASRRNRLQAEGQVRQWSHAVHQAPVSIVITDLTGAIEYVNPKFTEATGYTLEEVRGQNPRILKSGEMPREAYAQLWAAISAGREWRGEFHNRKKSGELFWESAAISPIRDAEGRITHYLATKEDITERKRTETLIREQAALLDNANDAIYVRDLDQTIRYWNRGAERLYGWTRDEAVGKLSTQLFVDDASLIDTIGASLLKYDSWSGEIRHINKLGAPLDIFSRCTLMRDEQGRPYGAFVINSDITGKKQLEAQFLRAQRLESLGALASGIAHDLNNMLAPILLAIPTLQRDDVPQETKNRLLSSMGTSAQRSAEIIRQVLTFARGIKGERITLQPRHLVHEVGNIIQETFPKNIQIELDIAPEIWPVLGDSTQIEQAVMNLCVNARDAMPDGGSLLLTLENFSADEALVQTTPGASVGPYVRFSVTDTGTGIPADILSKKIFEPFFTTKPPGLGTGLGLSTVLGIVRNHGGFVRVKSEMGRGSNFEFFLPATPATPIPVEPVASTDIVRARGELILVVDDEKTFQSIISRVLEEHGYRVLSAHEGTEAVGLFLQHQSEITAVIVDMKMPGMDGPALIRVLRHIQPTVRLIGTSGYGDFDGEDSEALELPAFLTKPFTSGKLLHTLEKICQLPPAPPDKAS
ncbi:MAG: PAS domain S-box protein [Opitutae bacterium]|nr:PAS domain S-box protein [Opitutae bacterium]